VTYCGTSLVVRESESPRFERSLPLDVSALPSARRQLRAFLHDFDLERDDVEAVLLCVQEACKNAVRFSGSSRGIDLSVTLDEGAVYAVVRDYGVGFDHSRLSHGAPDPLCPSGRGLFLISTLMDQVEIRASIGTEVRMCRVLA
jgi:anti-sigma regulatory factor (Ser/Thr protein kinase)